MRSLARGDSRQKREQENPKDQVLRLEGNQTTGLDVVAIERDGPFGKRKSPMKRRRHQNRSSVCSTEVDMIEEEAVIEEQGADEKEMEELKKRYKELREIVKEKRRELRQLETK